MTITGSHFIPWKPSQTKGSSNPDTRDSHNPNPKIRTLWLSCGYNDVETPDLKAGLRATRKLSHQPESRKALMIWFMILGTSHHTTTGFLPDW